ncbi:hypothetical protein [Fodinicola feengrottensis]|uniref:Holliday junction resolvase n=2 Tax=Fodinicola feengrottensis TaxID=435914 RepID=A0ABN2IAS7_9ACTN|nr:hypothetical protein [Fodinicola feengrottensis]
MSSANKAKGTAFETAIVRFLQDGGLRAARKIQHGYLDDGDVDIGPGDFTLQAKNYRNVTDGVREGVEGAEKQAAVAGTDYGVAVVKRARKPVADAYVVMTLRMFRKLAFELVELRKLRER